MVANIRKVSKNVQSTMQPGAFLVERIPILKHVPGYGRVLRRYREFELTLFREQLVNVKDKIVSPSDARSGTQTVSSYSRWARLDPHLAGRFSRLPTCISCP